MGMAQGGFSASTGSKTASNSTWAEWTQLRQLLPPSALDVWRNIRSTALQRPRYYDGSWDLDATIRIVPHKSETQRCCMLGSMHYMMGYTFIPHVQRSMGVLFSRQMHRTDSPDVESLDLSQVICRKFHQSPVAK